MRKKGRENAKWNCGYPVYYVGPDGVKEYKVECMAWDCPDCRKILIKKNIDNIFDCFDPLPGVQLFVRYIEGINAKAVSNFITRRVASGHHCRINCQDETVIISDRTFPAAEPMNKKKFFSTILPKILASPWDKGKRVSFSRGFKAPKEKPEKKPEGRYYARVPDYVARQYDEFWSDKEKARWLANKKGIKLFEKGEKFIKKQLAPVSDKSEKE